MRGVGEGERRRWWGCVAMAVVVGGRFSLAGTVLCVKHEADTRGKTACDTHVLCATHEADAPGTLASKRGRRGQKSKGGRRGGGGGGGGGGRFIQS